MSDEDSELDDLDDGLALKDAGNFRCVDCKKKTTRPQYGPPATDWFVRCTACFAELTGVERMARTPVRSQDKRSRAEKFAEQLRLRMPALDEHDRRGEVWARHLASPSPYAAWVAAYFKKNASPVKEEQLTRNTAPHDHWTRENSPRVTPDT